MAVARRALMVVPTGNVDGFWQPPEALIAVEQGESGDGSGLLG